MNTLEQQINELYQRNCSARTDPRMFKEEVMKIITTLPSDEKKCVRCHAGTKRFWHKVTPGIAVALIKINKAVNFKKENDINVGRLTGEFELTHSERSNWQKLRLHGLIARVRFFGMVKRGRWLITRKGYQFLSGHEIPQRVLSFRNHVEGHSAEMVTIEDVLRSTPHFESIEDIRFEYAPPVQEGESDVENSPIAPRKKKLKKGQIPCPKCGSAMRKCFESIPSKTDPNAVQVKQWNACTACWYNDKDV